MNSNHCIYVIFAPPGVYIGRSKNVLRRLQCHGMLLCDWAILESDVDPIMVREVEAKWVKYFVDAGCEVLNLDKNVSMPGILGHSEETRRRLKEFPRSETWCRRISESNKGISRNLGIPKSAETRRKMSKPKSAEHRAKIVAHLLQVRPDATGKKHSPDCNHCRVIKGNQYFRESRKAA